MVVLVEPPTSVVEVVVSAGIVEVVVVVVVTAGAAVSSLRLPGWAIGEDAASTTNSTPAAARISFSGVFRTDHLVGELERATGIEPAPPAWKAGALAVELRPPVPDDGSRGGGAYAPTLRSDTGP